MKKFFLLALFSYLAFQAQAQNLFPKKLDNCNTKEFCLDCGDTKANVDDAAFQVLLNNLNATNEVSNIKGRVSFQVLLDSTGQACVLSHTDVSDNIISRNIVSALNSFHGWIIAKTNGKKEGNNSFNMIFTIKDGKITARVDRINMDDFLAGFDHPRDPEIYNKAYIYKNEHLSNYKITTWNSKNSMLSDDLSDHIIVDLDGTVWYQTDKYLYKFADNKFTRIDQSNSAFNNNKWSVRGMATDQNNTKWFTRHDTIYSYNNKEWHVYDSTITGLAATGNIIANKSGEVFFTTDRGLLIYKDGQWSILDKSKIKALPSERVDFAKRDSKGRLWIGTFGGSIMIDKAGNVTDYNSTNTILKGQCITSMDEDNKGNVYFGLYEYGGKKEEINRNDGIGILSASGEWKQLTTSNSGMPANYTTAILYDKFEDVLWIATQTAGLVRYDLKGGWEDYHNKNSEIPTSHVSNIVQDAKGVIYLATRFGMVRVEKR